MRPASPTEQADRRYDLRKHDTEQAASGLPSTSAAPAVGSYAERLRTMKRIADLEDFARSLAALDDSVLLSADLNLYRALIREWRKQARGLTR